MTTLKQIRNAKGISAMTLATSLGISLMTIYRWESGAVVPSSEFLPKLQELLGLTDTETLELIKKD